MTDSKPINRRKWDAPIGCARVPEEDRRRMQAEAERRESERESRQKAAAAQSSPDQ